MLSQWLDQGIEKFTQLFPPLTFFSFEFNVRATLAVLLVSFACGVVGSLVVGNRMAFFSDALAHCAFAGVALGFLLALAAGVHNPTDFAHWVTPVMVVFGICVGLLIAVVREKTSLANDTVIGVFFAGAIGLGAIFLPFVSRRRYFNPENFLFGDPVTVTSQDLLYLVALVLITGAVLVFMYNDIVFASFNPSLALSRKVRVRFCNFTFIVLLALIVNLCLQTVGALLINAMLVVPAATAANLCRNLRQLFWCTVGLCLFVGAAGLSLSWQISVASSDPTNPISFGIGGIMVVLSVLLFFFSMLLSPRLRYILVPSWWVRDKSSLPSQGGEGESDIPI
jgi:zinc transport system permease protein